MTVAQSCSGSILICTSSFVDDVMFSYNVPMAHRVQCGNGTWQA